MPGEHGALQLAATSAKNPAIRQLEAVSAGAVGSTATTADEVVALRLRELLLCFPAAAIEGVRWHILHQKYEERYGEPLCSPEPPPGLLNGVASAVPGPHGPVLMLTDAAALMPSRCSIGHWPALYRRLCELIRSHGSVQPPSSLSVTKEDEVVTGEVLFAGLLLSQLKPLLQSHWDADFEEHSLGYFDEQGNFVRMRKMKQLVQSMLRWREQRLAKQRSGDESTSEVDTALQAPLDLAVSRQHSDMVLCCPLGEGGARGCDSTAPTVVPRGGGSGRRGEPLRTVCDAHDGDDNGRAGGLGTTGPKHGPVEATRCGLAADEVVRTCTAFERENLQLQRENLQLRIENAELKKQVRFSADSFLSQIRLLRVENAELRKRLFGVPPRFLTTLPTTPEQLLPAPSPTSPDPSHVAAFDDPFEPPPETHRVWCDSWSNGSSSGVASPACHPHRAVGSAILSEPTSNSTGHTTSATPALAVPFLYTMVPGQWSAPWHAQLTSPPSQRSPLSTISPLSNLSRCFPHGLLDSRSSSSLGSLVGGPSPLPNYEGPGDLLAADDRATIPSGIVEQHRARFEHPDAPGAEAPDGVAPAPEVAIIPETAPASEAVLAPEMDGSPPPQG